MESQKNRTVDQIAETREQEMLRSHAPEDLTTQLLCKLIDSKRKACGAWALEFLNSIYEMVRMTLTREQLLAAVEQADTLKDALEEELNAHIRAKLHEADVQGLCAMGKRKCCQE